MHKPLDNLTAIMRETGGQVVLYDFDQAQIDGYPAKYGNAEEPLGKVLRDISHSASVGYDQVNENMNSHSLK